jgi:NADH:ubiquinone oxidoreductase subunit E
VPWKVITVSKSVLVIGGGIAGLQSSIDLANMGFQVYLVERSPTIGGRMAQLDKTFPTNDCAMCILAPKMIEASRHPNIRLLTYSEVESLEGESPRFRVRIRKKARYVDERTSARGVVCAGRTVPSGTYLKSTGETMARQIDQIIDRYVGEDGALIQLLLDVQKELNWVPKKLCSASVKDCNVPLSQVYRVASFYNSISLEARGRHTVSVCLGTACQVRSAPRVMDRIRDLLGINAWRDNHRYEVHSAKGQLPWLLRAGTGDGSGWAISRPGAAG